MDEFDYRQLWDEKFEQCTNIATELWHKFNPVNLFNIDPENDQLSANDDEIVLSMCHIEVRSIKGKIKVPGFRLEKLTIMPATLWEPEDSTVTHIGEYKTAVEAAAAFVNLAITTKVENYAHYLNAKESFAEGE